MPQRPTSPGEVEVLVSFCKHLGPRFTAAGVGLQFHYNQTPGIHFKAAISEQFKQAVVRGIEEGLSLRFPEFPKTGAVWVTRVVEHEVDSTWNAFYLVAKLAIDQAFALTLTAEA